MRPGLRDRKLHGEKAALGIQLIEERRIAASVSLRRDPERALQAASLGFEGIEQFAHALIRREGVFDVAGDVSHGSIKRVAAGVGEGSRA